MGKVIKLVARKINECKHDESILVDEQLEYVKCNKCGEALNPIWVLRRFALKRATLKGE